MKLIIFILSVSIPFVFINCKSNKLETTKKTVSSTKIDRNHQDFYPTGELKNQGQFEANKKTGKWISYYKNGDEKSIQNYEDGELDGYQKIGYSQILYMEGYSKNGIKVGSWKSYFKKNNQLKYSKYFDDFGNATGEWKSYYDSGELYLVENYLNNQLNGKQTVYFKNGNILSEGNLKNGKYEGIWKYYNEKGALVREKQFKDGVEIKM